MCPTPSIRVQGLTKRYGDFEAVKGLDFEVHEGEVFGLLGPNGAGKTSTVEILEGLRPRTSGEVSVLGFDPSTQSRALKERIGVCLQATHLPDKVRVHEALELFSQLYQRSVAPGPLLEKLKLSDKRNAFYSSLSGGQKQRLALALALVNDPQVLFLDEPTASLDPQVRHEIHDLVDSLRKEQRTLLLTTHYIEEAEKLCDRIAIIDGGRIIALGTPAEIRASTPGHSAVEVVLETPLPPGQTPPVPDGDTVTVSEDLRTLRMGSAKPAKALVAALRWLDAKGLEVADVHLRRPTLEDAFITLTGRKLRE